MDRHFGRASRRSHLLILAGLAFGLGLGSPHGSALALDATQPRYRIVGYVLGSRDQDFRGVDSTKLTHINYAFANLKGGRAVLEWPEADGARIAQLQSLRSRNPELKILLSVGGGAWSDGFSDAALTGASRSAFTLSAIELLKRYAFDGLDIDWEYPAQPGPSRVFRPEDTADFTLLLQVLRAALDEQSRIDGRVGGRRYQLSIATNVSPGYGAHVELGVLHRYVDHICLMGYDNFGPWTERSGHHANLFPPDAEPSALSAAGGVDGHLAAGVPPEKIVLGVAFYGYLFPGADPANRGLYRKYSGQASAVSYAELVDKYVNKNGFTRYWDDVAKAPYLWNPETRTVITYDDPQSHAAKVQYVKRKGLGGVMYWEHFHDPGETLLDGLHRGLSGP